MNKKVIRFSIAESEDAGAELEMEDVPVTVLMVSCSSAAEVSAATGMILRALSTLEEQFDKQVMSDGTK